MLVRCYIHNGSEFVLFLKTFDVDYAQGQLEAVAEDFELAYCEVQSFFKPRVKVEYAHYAEAFAYLNDLSAAGVPMDSSWSFLERRFGFETHECKRIQKLWVIGAFKDV